LFAVDASLGSEAAVGLDNPLRWDAGGALKTVNVLCEEHV
jgi:hypothetical protein